MPFNPERAPLLRVLLVNGKGDSVLTLSAHHLIADARTMELFLEKLAAGYETPEDVVTNSSPVRYRDFARWEAERLAGGAWASQEAFWRARLASLRPADLPTDHPRAPARIGRGRRLSRRIPAAAWRILRAFAQSESVTPVSLVLDATRHFIG